ncbi:keratin-associated protein 4-4-like [Physella acuta]|uniref:keratin-associated protein 4-4-like n=1 Tax=Physella acuta TaxID=109671 RepID=UPI0027DD1824|nr:keratin-associated protein 4-4-like [Physella acuta]
MMSITAVVLMGATLMMFSTITSSDGQTINVDLNKGFNYNTPLYCSAIVSGLSDCKPSACFWSGSRSECCMNKATSVCKCSSKVNCPVEPALKLEDGPPNYCEPKEIRPPVLSKTCSNFNNCFTASGKVNCCYSIEVQGGKYVQSCLCLQEEKC